jgi:hypothetical protein
MLAAAHNMQQDSGFEHASCRQQSEAGSGVVQATCFITWLSTYGQGQAAAHLSQQSPCNAIIADPLSLIGRTSDMNMTPAVEGRYASAACAAVV